MTKRQILRGPERLLFIVHGVVTLAAAVVLAAFPAAIPATVGITIAPEAYLLSYFLAAAELGVAVLSLGATRLTDPPAIRLIAATFAAFHLATAALEILFVALDGFSGVLLANIVVRLVVGVVFGLVWRSRRS